MEELNFDRMALPSCIALKSENNRYLTYMRDSGHGDVGGGDQDPSLHGYLQLSEKMVERPWTKFEVEISGKEEQLFHIKCCYNNRYWARIANSDFVAAVADEPQEERTEWSCTLFKLVSGVNSGRVGFEHVQSQSHLSIAEAESSSFNDCLLVSGKEDSKTSFTVIDWHSLVFLPRYVAFKDDHGKYLRSCMIGLEQYLQFSADVTETTANEIIPAGDGTVRIKHGDKFWTTVVHKKGLLLPSRTNWILLDGKASDRDNQIFLPQKVSHHGESITLHNVGSDLACKRLTQKGKIDCLAAHLPITKESHIQVEEYVKERRIDNVRYHFRDARIYSEKSTQKRIRSAYNNTKKVATVSFVSQENSHITSSWKSSASSKLFSSISISATIPLFTGELEASGEEYNGAYEWGTTINFLKVVENAPTLTVPEKGTATLYATVKQVAFDVPFTYTQRDILLNGEKKVEEMEDGIYSGTNSYYDYYSRKQSSGVRDRLVV